MPPIQSISVLDVVLVVAMGMLFFLLFVAMVWSGWRELYIRRLHEVDSINSREMVKALADVTGAIELAIKTVESSTSMNRESKSEILQAMAQAEMRLSQLIQKISSDRIVNHFSGHNVDGNVGQAGGRISNE